jgi:hypothetical protein
MALRRIAIGTETVNTVNDLPVVTGRGTEREVVERKRGRRTVREVGEIRRGIGREKRRGRGEIRKGKRNGREEIRRERRNGLREKKRRKRDQGGV